MGSKNDEFTTLTLIEEVQNDNYCYFANIKEQILCFSIIWGGLQFCSPIHALAGSVGCQFKVFGPQIIYFWRLGGSKRKIAGIDNSLIDNFQHFEQKYIDIISKSFIDCIMEPPGSSYMC